MCDWNDVNTKSVVLVNKNQYASQRHTWYKSIQLTFSLVGVFIRGHLTHTLSFQIWDSVLHDNTATRNLEIQNSSTSQTNYRQHCSISTLPTCGQNKRWRDSQNSTIKLRETRQIKIENSSGLINLLIISKLLAEKFAGLSLRPCVN